MEASKTVQPQRTGESRKKQPTVPPSKRKNLFRPLRAWPRSPWLSIPMVAVNVNSGVSAQHRAGVYSGTREVIARIPPPYRQATPPWTSVTRWGWLRENHRVTCVHAGEISSSENPTQTRRCPVLCFVWSRRVPVCWWVTEEIVGIGVCSTVEEEGSER